MATNPMRFQNRKTAIVTGILIAGALLSLAGVYLSVTDLSFKRQAFASGTWKAADAKVRGTMVDDLLQRGLLQSRSAQEVTALLGPPDSTGDPYGRGDHYLTYRVFMGKRLGSTPWPHFLHLVLPSPEGSVQRAYVAD